MGKGFIAYFGIAFPATLEFGSFRLRIAAVFGEETEGDGVIWRETVAVEAKADSALLSLTSAPSSPRSWHEGGGKDRKDDRLLTLWNA